MTLKDLKKEFGKAVKSLGLGFSGSQFDFLWEYVEKAYKEGKKEGEEEFKEELREAFRILGKSKQS